MPRNFPLLKSFQFEVVAVDKQGKICQRDTKKAEYFTEDLGNGIALDLVAIKGGKFLMGAPLEEKSSKDEERPQHEVKIRSFFMGKLSVTQAQWRALASLPKVERDLEKEPSHFRGDHRPVENVSWYDAVEFCARLSRKTGRQYRLPSEAEWEYAIRAQTTTPFLFGETMTSDLANYNGDYTYASEPKGKMRGETTPVGSYTPNAFGLYELHGNVWEWCADHWHDNYQGAPIDGSAWLKDDKRAARIIRGGSWFNYPRHCRCACRDLNFPDCGNNLIGFRVVCGLATTSSYSAQWLSNFELGRIVSFLKP